MRLGWDAGSGEETMRRRTDGCLPAVLSCYISKLGKPYFLSFVFTDFHIDKLHRHAFELDLERSTSGLLLRYI